MPATATLYPTTVAGTTGTTWTTTTNATGSGTGTTSAAWAVFTSTGNPGTGTISLSGYAAQSAGPASGDTIDSVVLSLRGNVAATNRWTAASCTAQLFAATTAIGSPQAIGTLSTSTSNVWTITFTGANAPTYAQLADLRLTVTAVHTTTTSSTFNVDTAGIVVNYTSPAAPTVGAGADDDHLVNTAFTRTATESNGGATITARSWTLQSGPGVTPGTSIGTTAALSWTPTTAGTYVIRYSATNSVGTTTDDATIYVEAAAAVNDTFTRTSTTDPGTADTGQKWLARTGTWGTNGTQLYPVTALDNDIASVMVGVTDQTVRATIPALPSGAWSILARYETSGTFFSAEVTSAGVIELKQALSGTIAAYTATAAGAASAGSVIELSAIEETTPTPGTRLIVKSNGVEVINQLSTVGRPQNGIRAGVRQGFNGGALRWDDFQVNYSSSETHTTTGTASATASAARATTTTRTTAGTATATAAATGVVAHPLVGTLTDTFATLDAAKWTYAANASIVVGQLQLTTSATYRGAVSVRRYDLTGSAAAIEVPQTATQTAGSGNFTNTEFALELDVNNRVQIVREGTFLYFQRRIGGTYTNAASVTYNATTHRWWKISESGGTITWWTSPDGTTWTSQGTWVISGLAITGLQVQLTTGFYDTTTAATAAIFDNLNTVGAETHTTTGTATATATATRTTTTTRAATGAATATASATRTVTSTRTVARTASATASASGATTVSRATARTASATASATRTTSSTRATARTATATATATGSTVGPSPNRTTTGTALATASTSRTTTTNRTTTGTATATASATQVTTTARTSARTATATASASRTTTTGRVTARTAAATATATRTTLTNRIIIRTAAATATATATRTTLRLVTVTASALATASGVTAKAGADIYFPHKYETAVLLANAGTAVLAGNGANTAVLTGNGAGTAVLAAQALGTAVLDTTT